MAGVSCGDPDPGIRGEPVRIGVIVSLTGDLAAVGPHLENSARLVEREVNAAGGLLGGRRLELVVRDDRTEASQAAVVARDLIENEGVVAIVGSLGSAASLAVAEVTSEARVPQISCCSTSQDLTTAQPEDDRYLFRTVPSDLLQAVVLARHAESCTALAILHIDDSYGNPFGAAIEQNFSARGGNVVGRVAFRGGRPSYAAEVAEVRTLNPDCIALVAFPENGGTILREWDALPDSTDVRWIGTDGVKDNGLVLEAGRPELVDGVEGTAPIVEPDTPSFQTYAALYLATFSEGVGIFGGNQYDATALLVLAIEAAGSTDGSAIRDALFQVSNPGEPGDTQPFFGPGDLGEALGRIREGTDIDYNGAGGPVDLDPNGDVRSDYETWIYSMDAMAFTRTSIIRSSEL
jgi:ABC-type branched-subunit amino acid transport system substrate-binding protein